MTFMHINSAPTFKYLINIQFKDVTSVWGKTLKFKSDNFLDFFLEQPKFLFHIEFKFLRIFTYFCREISKFFVHVDCHQQSLTERN